MTTQRTLRGTLRVSSGYLNSLFLSLPLKKLSPSSPHKHYKLLFLLSFFKKSACNKVLDVHCRNHRRHDAAENKSHHTHKTP